LKELKIIGMSYFDMSTPNPERKRGKERNELKLIS
jgi:hypothetical protein